MTALLLVASCSSGTSTPVANSSPTSAATVTATAGAQPSAAPSAIDQTPAPSAAAYAVVAGDGAIDVLGSNGGVLVTASLTIPYGPFDTALPWVSVTSSRVYYLDAGKTLRFIGLDGTSGTLRDLPVNTATEEAGISVSPDGSRIAVAVLSYDPAPSGQGVGSAAYAGMRMYVENTADGADKAYIFSSTTVAEFPIGWVHGNLVIAVGDTPLCCQAEGINPYSAVAYHVADPTTGRRIATLCAASQGPEGPAEPVGTLCEETSGPPKYEWWDGREVPLPAAVPSPGRYLVALSPDGVRVAAGGTPIRILSGGLNDVVLNVSGTVVGWLDADHVVYTDASTFDLAVVSVTSGTVVPLPGGGKELYIGPIPAALS
ncbi:MAG TPA: hypothetical protein VKT20_02730 [Candidatus Dormibacteraeota bacterium]|nr:hypothetical protein [Candidatus Dormibacteraeota bacterium]